MRALLAPAVAALLVAALLSGCTGLAAGSGIAARDGYATAQSRAASWDAEAVLGFLAAIEVTDVENATETMERELNQEAGAMARELIPLIRAVFADGDPYPGDGFAPAWAYFFVAPSGLRVVVVDAGGSVTYDNDFLAGMPIEDVPAEGLEDGWSIDSDEAARIAAANNTAFAKLLGSPLMVGNTNLEMGEDGPVWQVGLSALSGGDSFAVVWVDAQTGAVVNSYPRNDHPPNRGPPTPPPVEEPTWSESGSTQGSLTPVISDTAEDEFAIAFDGHAQLALLLEARNAVGLVQVTATVTDPDGNEYILKATGVGGLQSLSADEVVDMPLAGDWTVRVSLDQGTLQQYTFSWCTDGEATQDTSDNPACDAVAGNSSRWLA